MDFHLGFWDYGLIVVVSVQATLLAYLRAPRLKALVLSFPVPFSMAFLALGQPVDATNVLGMGLLILFMHGVRVLHILAGWSILLSIAVAALGYGAASTVVAPWVPSGGAVFWVSLVLMAGVAIGVLRVQEHREELPHRSPLPVWIKVPIIAAVILVLVLMKQWLRGFITMFPMVSIIAAYEARHSLWTMSRQIPVFMLAAIPMMAAIRLVQPAAGAGWALAAGWGVFGVALWLVTRWERRGRRSNGVSE